MAANTQRVRHVSSKVIQVPMAVAMVEDLDSRAVQQGRSRADLIREACGRYLKHLDREEKDRAYREGYERFPEDPAIGLAGVALMAELLPDEEW